MVTHEFRPFRGGAATFVRELATELAASPGGTEVWAPDYGKPHESGDRADAFCTVRWPNAGTLALGNLWRLHISLARSLRPRAPDLLVLGSVGALKAALLLRWRRPGAFPARMVAVFHGSEILKFNRGPFWGRQMRRALAGGWLPACTGQAVEAAFRAAPWAAAAKAVLRVPCALPSAIRHAALAVQPSTPPDVPFRLLTLARLHPRKGQLELAAAFHHLPDDLRPRLQWVLAGAGDAAYRAQAVAKARAAGVRVEDLRAPAEEDLASIYQGCSAYAMTSRTLPDSMEGFGLTYLEAGAFGLPVVGAATGGVAEAIRHEETGLIVPEADPVATAAALQRLLTDPELAKRLGQAGRAHALASTWRTAADAVLG